MMYVILYVFLKENMLPKIVNPSEFRKHLADFLSIVQHTTLVIKGKHTNAVLVNEQEYNRLSALANQFVKEDPEGEYRPEFEKEITSRMQEHDIDPSLSSLHDLT